jgi:hypothetical protein
LIGRKADEVFPPPLGQSYRAQDETPLKTGDPILNQLELQLHHHDRLGWCLTNKLPLRGRLGRVVGLVFVDLAEFSILYQTPLRCRSSAIGRMAQQ